MADIDEIIDNPLDSHIHNIHVFTSELSSGHWSLLQKHFPLIKWNILDTTYIDHVFFLFVWIMINSKFVPLIINVIITF